MKTELLDRKDLANHRAILLEALMDLMEWVKSMDRRETLGNAFYQAEEAIKKTTEL